MEEADQEWPSSGSPYCSDISIEAGEPLTANAAPTSLLLLLEYNGAWGEKALEESDVPAALKERLQAFGKSHPQAKILLIRSTRSLIQPGIRFFVARTSDGRPDSPEAVIYDFHVAAYEDLLDVDIPAVLSGDPAYARHRRTVPLFLVCTNGRRDRCCARYGVAVFNALLEQARDDPAFAVWQCSHIGGHRFAANLICLPSGMLYGRVRSDDVAALLSAELDGRIYLPNLRGRMAFPPVAQAADRALRQALDEPRLGALRLADLEPQGEQAWLARFEQTTGGRRYAVHIQAHATGQQVFESCQLDKPTPVIEYAFQIEDQPA